MKNFTKKLALLLVFAMVLGVVSPTIVAKAATGDLSIATDFTTLSVTVKKEGADDVKNYEFAQYVSKDGKAPGNDEIKKIKDKDWVTVDEEETDGVGDISWFNKKKDSYIVVRIPNGNEYTYVTSAKIEAQKSAVKVHFSKDAAGSAVSGKSPAFTAAQSVGSAETGYLVFYKVNTDKSMTVVSPSSVAYRVDGTYFYTQIDTSTFKTVLQKAKAKGATLLFVDYVVTETQTEKNDGWVVAETKYKYAAQKAAPSVKLGTDRIVPLKAGLEYRFVVGNKKSDWISVDDNHATKDGKKVKVNSKILITDLIVTGAAAEIQANGTLTDATIYGKNLKLQFRTAATDKVIASKISTVAVTQTAIDTSKSAASYASIGYKVKYDTTKGIEIKNLSDDDTIEYAIVATTTAVGTTKWTAIKGGKTAAVNAKALKDSNDKPYTHILVRKAGDKKAGLMASPFVAQAIEDIPTATQQITANANGSLEKNYGTYTVVSTGAVSATVNVSVAALTVSGTAIEKVKVTVGATGLVETKGSAKWSKKGSNNAYKVYDPTYENGTITFVFDIKKDTKAGDSGDYECKVEGLSFKFKITVK